MGIIPNTLRAPASEQLHTRGIYESVTQTIGNTPLVRLNKLMAKNASLCSVLGKLEYFNPMSSTKDRPALAMIEALMASAEFTPQTHIIEATSGNNGVSCAWICAMHNIPLTIVIPEHMSIERIKMIKHFGAEVITTPKDLGTKGAIDLARKMVNAKPEAVSLDQFGNQANPDAHAASTAMEILRDSDGNIDIFVAGVGTGGSISGIGGALKQHNTNIQVVAVEPASCPMLSQGVKGVHAIQGLSSGHIPDILNQSVIDDVHTVTDADAMAMARELAKVEGMPVGISSGATVAAAMRLSLLPANAGKNIVVILADTAERYYSTDLFIS